MRKKNSRGRERERESVKNREIRGSFKIWLEFCREEKELWREGSFTKEWWVLYLRCRKLTLFAKRRTMLKPEKDVTLLFSAALTIFFVWTWLNLAGLGWAERKVGPLCKEMRGGKIDSKVA
jgi:hypothetical protein